MGRLRGPVLAVVLALLLASAGCATLAEDPDAPSTGATTTGATASTGPSAGGQATEWEVTVVRVVDGDTFEVRFPDGHTENVRLLGVDTPEVHVENDPDEFEGIPSTPAGNDWLRDWGHRASEFARSEVAGQEVQIAVDGTADRRGGFGRLLVYVYLPDGTLFNRELIERGYARVYATTFSKRSEFDAAERAARDDGIGLWGFSGETTTDEDPGEDTGLAVAAVQADAPGNDHDNLNGEYVVFENVGDRSLDLGGWTVRDEAGHTYVFPTGTVLDPGERVTLYTGSGSDTDTELYWGSDRAVWNNDGDTIVVADDDGTVVVRTEYP